MCWHLTAGIAILSFSRPRECPIGLCLSLPGVSAMAELEKQVRRVWRRLNLQRFLNILVWCWAAALVLALAWITAEKLWHPLIEPWWGTLLGSLALGLLAAAVLWYCTRQSTVDAALALDKAFGLKERVSTTLVLSESLRDSPAGLALVTDTLHRVEAIDVSEKFAFRLPRHAWVPLVPAALLCWLALFVGPLGGQGSVQAARSEVTKERAQVQQSTKQLTRRLDKQKEEAKQEGLAEAEKLLAEIQKASKDLAESKDIDQKQALAKLHDIQDTLKDRREKLGSAEQLQRQLEKMQLSAQKGPAEKLEEALKQGDFKKAAQELSKIAEQLKTGKLDEAQKKALEKQLGQMKDQLKKLADLEERRKQLEKAGLPKDVLQQELAKLDAQAKQLQKLQELAEKLGNAQEAMQKGDLAKALENLDLSKADMEQMMKDLKELQMLENALNDLADMKNAMVCKNCDGAG